ncbi:MAG TPA: RsmB/NOP family class I SAM-dependent RNA methyltransferase [Rhodospirillaceae bacterium]|nr:RsmB/NOP family class I SAM-dependent RNA methyltransferase [Rhodospirillaceae bacterium]
MKPSARVQAVIDVIERIPGARVPMDTIVGDYMRPRRYIGAKDRANIAERVYGIIRAQARLNWWLKKSGAGDTPRLYVLAYLVLAEGAGEKRMDDLFDGSKHSPATLDEQERILIKKLEGKPFIGTDMPEAVRTECPPEHEEKLREIFGKDFRAEMEAMIDPAPLDLRVNIWSANRDEVKKSLEKDGVETLETPYSPWGLRCKEKSFLSKTKALTKGYIQIQDEGSQLIAYVCGAKPGMQVLDYCAGAGGKTLALAAAMQRKGRIVATDNDEKRLAKGKMRFKKSGLADIIEVRALSEERHRKWLRRQKGTFDVVLADVPCTGSGTWRRNPDMRWQSYGPGLDELVKVQSEILAKIAPVVKPGGRLVYATCSLFKEENENQIEAFLKAHEEYKIVPVDERFGNPYMRLTPRHHGTDGFFAAVLERKKQ